MTCERCGGDGVTEHGTTQDEFGQWDTVTGACPCTDPKTPPPDGGGDRVLITNTGRVFVDREHLIERLESDFRLYDDTCRSQANEDGYMECFDDVLELLRSLAP